MLVSCEALWSAVAIEPPLWEGGGRLASRERSKHHTLRVVTIPPPSQSGGSIATALQSFVKCAASCVHIEVRDVWNDAAVSHFFTAYQGEVRTINHSETSRHRH